MCQGVRPQFPAGGVPKGIWFQGVRTGLSTYTLTSMFFGTNPFQWVMLIATAGVQNVVDWELQLDRLGGGDHGALSLIRRLVTGQLMRMRAYEAREGWDDLAQEIIIRVWRSHRDRKIRDYRALPGFVRMLTRNAVVDAHRKKQPDLGKEEDEVERRAEAPSATLDPATQLALRKALSALSERHREVVERVYIQGLSYDETASDLGKPRGTVNRLQREAMQQLREILVDNSGEID